MLEVYIVVKAVFNGLHKYLRLCSFVPWLYLICIFLTFRYFPIYPYVVRFEVFTAVTMKNGVFWVVTPWGSCN
jgi:hypothetical protein